MKVTLAGDPGSGKSVLRKHLAERYGFEVKAVGDFMREIAGRHGYTDITKFLVEYVTHHPEVDHQVDEEQRRFGETNDHFVLDSHIGFHFVPDSLKIRLTCELEESARRILNAGRTTEAAKDLTQAMQANAEREAAMRQNFLKLYEVDIHDNRHFDLVVDTTPLALEQVQEKVCDFIDQQSKEP
ncbi:MAG: AAA family ATPase [SAR324 cluster bacterium]|nr:AAA family ATPase [SAR324 cluster bacterium]